MTEREELEGGMAAPEAQRAVLGDAVVDTALAALRARLARLDSPAQQLRPVTILFADVVGSTSVSQQLDPEDIQTVMDGALRRFTSLVEARSGKVLQYAGDSLLAVFGFLEAREDDPERAVRAGLDILDEASRLGRQLRGRYGHNDFNVRVGVHTGPVLLGGGVDADSSIRGIAVNIAARLEQAAPVGRLRVSHTTYRHVRGLFEVSEEPPLSVKGISDPVRSYIVLGAKPGTFEGSKRGPDGTETPLIGRDAELAELIAAFETVRTRRSSFVVTLVGDAGLGKTRLMLEFERWLEVRHATAARFHGRAQAYGTHMPYGLVRGLFGGRFEILDDDTQAVAHAKLTKGLAVCFGDHSEEPVALIGHLIGLDYSASPHISGIAGDGSQLRNRAFHAVGEYFRLLLDQNGAPIVMLLDDLHWADDGSLDLFDYVAQACRDVPMFLLCLTRPELLERRPSWIGHRSRRERLDLGPLSEQSSRELVDSLLRQLASIPHALRDVVVGNADGNPFFIEELVAMLVDNGVIATDGASWVVATDRLVDVPIPSTLAGVLQCRLDALPTAETTALQQASVIGYVFWDEPLERMAPGAPRVLPDLVRRDLVRVRESSTFDGAREYAFKHHLLHQATYEGVSAACSKCSATMSAATYWRRAGEAAAKTYAVDTALDFLSRAIGLIPLGEPEPRYGVMTSRIHILNLTGRRREEGDEIAELERLAEALEDNAKRAGAASLRARFAICTGDSAMAAASAARAVALAEDGGHTAIALLSRSVWASALLAQGEHRRPTIRDADRPAPPYKAGARRLAEELLGMARAVGNDRRVIDALHLQGSLAKMEGRYGLAREYFVQALHRARAIFDKVFESVQLANLGDVERSMGNYVVATDRLEAGLRLCRHLGGGIVLGHGLLELAELAQVRGDSQAALAYVAEGLPIAREISHRQLEAQLLVVRGDAELELGRPIEAATSYHHALENLPASGEPGAVVDATAGLARAAIAVGNVEGALAYIARVEAGIHAGRDLNRAPELLWTCHTALAAARSPRAHDLLVRAHSLLIERSKLLDEADRATYLDNVPPHRAIMTAWTAPT